MGLSPTARGLRLIRSTRSPAITVPPPAGGQPLMLVTEAQAPIGTETGATIVVMESA